MWGLEIEKQNVRILSLVAQSGNSISVEKSVLLCTRDTLCLA